MSLPAIDSPSAPPPDAVQHAQRLARLIALYLPQFHPTPENDEWWGKGFTEWTNVTKARPLFPGHHQPNLPADLGFYDLRVPETRIAQAELARAHGVEAFCYWHYWFAGRRILDRPFEEVLRSGEPDFPFCLAWANHSWTGTWYGAPNRILIEQTYPGEDDYRRHFDWLLKAFHDPRYVRCEGNPVFFIFRPPEIPDTHKVTDLWREWAAQAGLPGLHLVGIANDASWDPPSLGFDAATTGTLFPMFSPHSLNFAGRLRRKVLSNSLVSSTIGRLSRRPIHVYDYSRITDLAMAKGVPNERYYPCVLPNWDSTPRSGVNGSVLSGSNPKTFRAHFQMALRAVADRAPQQKIIVLKSWNEWAEGNYMEPDRRFGRAYLEVVRDEIFKEGLLSSLE